MGASIEGRDSSILASRAIPTTGMRGGLGRTLLTAFLTLAIVPLALVGWYALQQSRQHLEAEVAGKLEVIAALQAAGIERQVDEWQTLLSLVRESESTEDMVLALSVEEYFKYTPGLRGIASTGGTSQSRWSLGNCEPSALYLTDISAINADEMLVLPLPQEEGTLFFCVDGDFWGQGAQTTLAWGEATRIYMVLPEAKGASVETLPLLATEKQSGVYRNYQGISVIGAYVPLPQLGLGILVEQAVAEIDSTNERTMATLIAVVLGLALSITAIVAIVIRRITRPVIQLTESALAMAGGDLEQYVPVTSRDEIGILTYVFNQMAAELKSLYDGLEAKVAERTKLLQRANYLIQWRALQLEASLEVSKAITSYRDPNLLLERVAGLIQEQFIYISVAVYLMEPGGGAAQWRAASPRESNWPDRVTVGDGTVMAKALQTARIQSAERTLFRDNNPLRRGFTTLAIPLCMETRVLGVVAILRTDRETSQEDDRAVLLHLANQITVALENARAYERERLAAQQLEEAELFKTRFLANMSHDLREPLNSVIGFSRLLLKGLDGPLSKQQAQDVQRIHTNSQRLLQSISDILTISQIQAGLMALDLQPVDLQKMIGSVLPTAEAFVYGEPIVLKGEIEPSLPLVWGDATRIRQILLHLLSNAAKFTERGEIVLRVWAAEDWAYVSIRDTGVGIPEQERERIFTRFEKGNGRQSNSTGAGLGLALSKQFVEMHGGQIWVESEVGVGSTFTFSLPLLPLEIDEGE
ncbi:MAG: ATP-binding protein [Chloroflexota bacterium]|nr:ATP-binding protein [Chloroflexota bacterium]